MPHQPPEIQPVPATQGDSLHQTEPGMLWSQCPACPHLLLCSHECNHSVNQFRELIQPKNINLGGIKKKKKNLFSASECVPCMTTPVPEAQRWKHHWQPKLPLTSILQSKNSKYILPHVADTGASWCNWRGQKSPWMWLHKAAWTIFQPLKGRHFCTGGVHTWRCPGRACGSKCYPDSIPVNPPLTKSTAPSTESENCLPPKRGHQAAAGEQQSREMCKALTTVH